MKLAHFLFKLFLIERGLSTRNLPNIVQAFFEVPVEAPSAVVRPGSEIPKPYERRKVFSFLPIPNPSIQMVLKSKRGLIAVTLYFAYNPER